MKTYPVTGKIMDRETLDKILKEHKAWLEGGTEGKRADLTYANLTNANLRGANLIDIILRGADLRGADLRGANLTVADLTGANLTVANLTVANLTGANLTDANLRGACLREVNILGTKGLVKPVGVEPGNKYWKRFGEGLKNNGYQFKVGLNELDEGEIFASDPREICSYPGFHFASFSWCGVNYPNRPLEALIQIPEDAEINEPWATYGKASASKIIILKVYDTATGEEVTNQYRRK